MTFDTVAIGMLTMVLSQIVKKMLPGEGWGPAVVAAMSLIATAAWIATNSVTLSRTDAFPILNAWAGITLTAMGAYSAAKMDTSGTIDAFKRAGGKARRSQARPLTDEDDHDEAEAVSPRTPGFLARASAGSRV